MLKSLHLIIGLACIVSGTIEKNYATIVIGIINVIIYYIKE